MFFRLPDWLRYEIEHRWERLAVNTRRRINAHPRLIIGITAASVFVLSVAIVWLSWPEKSYLLLRVTWFRLSRHRPDRFPVGARPVSGRMYSVI